MKFLSHKIEIGGRTIDIEELIRQIKEHP